MRILPSLAFVIACTSCGVSPSTTTSSSLTSQGAKTPDKIGAMITGLRFISDKYLTDGTPSFSRLPKEIEVSYADIGSDIKDVFLIVNLVSPLDNGNFILHHEGPRDVSRALPCVFEKRNVSHKGPFHDTRVCKVESTTSSLDDIINSKPMVPGYYAIWSIVTEDTSGNHASHIYKQIGSVETPGERFNASILAPVLDPLILNAPDGGATTFDYWRKNGVPVSFKSQPFYYNPTPAEL